MGFHLYYRLGTDVFDFNGWSTESDLLAAIRFDYSTRYSGWDFDLVVVETSLEEFCREFGHRPPRDFFSSPTSRALSYARTMGVARIGC